MFATPPGYSSIHDFYPMDREKVRAIVGDIPSEDIRVKVDEFVDGGVWIKGKDEDLSFGANFTIDKSTKNERFFIAKLEQPVVLLSQTFNFYGDDADYKDGVEAGYAGVPEQQLSSFLEDGILKKIREEAPRLLHEAMWSRMENNEQAARLVSAKDWTVTRHEHVEI